jgi:L-alanine-DL-glutamate epimerase-like enolase superfamily enzyme
MPLTSLDILRVECWPVDIPITDPFVVATGARLVAENIFIRVTLSGGAKGYGEAAPFPEVGGENRESCLAALRQLGEAILGHSAAAYEDIGRSLSEQAPTHPAARCGLETACIDAYCHASNIPMWHLWGSADVRQHETDITIPICHLDKTLSLAREWHARGFRLFKMKVGNDVREDIRRLEAVYKTCPGIAFIGDANQGFSREDCLTFANGIKKFGGRMVLLEQPVVRDDLDSLAAIRLETGIPVAADESARSLEDAREIVKRGAADYVNIKIMKTGVTEALEIASFTKQAGLKLMIGGMVESRIAMGCSFSLVLGLGGFEILDLDTPLLLARDPVEGGYHYNGSRLVPWQDSGLGMRSVSSRDMMMME